MRSAQKYGLTPKQIQGLAAEYPSLVSNRYEQERFQAIARAEHIEPGQFGGMLERVAKYMRDHHGAAVDYFFRGTDQAMRQGNPPANDPNSTRVQSRPEWIRLRLEKDFPELARSLQWLGAHWQRSGGLVRMDFSGRLCRGQLLRRARRLSKRPGQALRVASSDGRAPAF